MFKLCPEVPPSFTEVLEMVHTMQQEWVKERGVGRKQLRYRTRDAFARGSLLALDMGSIRHNGGARHRNQWRELSTQLDAVWRAYTFLR